MGNALLGDCDGSSKAPKRLIVDKLEIPEGSTSADWMLHCWPLVLDRLIHEKILSEADELRYIPHPYNKKVFFVVSQEDVADRKPLDETGDTVSGFRKFMATSATYVVKFESCERMHPNVPTEMEHIQDLAAREDRIAQDPRVVFPECAFHIVEKTTQRQVVDMLVMPNAPGLQMHVIINELQKRGAEEDLEELCLIMHKVGEQLADFHNTYSDEADGGPTHHRDLQTSNLFFSEENESIAFIDLPYMGRPGPRDDLEKFTNSLSTNAGLKNRGWHQQVVQSFLEGYHGDDA
eukprot:gnl/MRDRNA2_/MRDRNA2_131733_c0_seq1.p1 gnl/MRDRNA2_/MRDRNA2_131733_c0~~gnl/MRDRNA2_/MRDRNA2_131733_c0_seq1.p1  ORF type:complete len:292 (+),score=54.95 gnl/MRDRNA2_/MRDRNA2_131733_c0_seq1:97-972(+)